MNDSSLSRHMKKKIDRKIKDSYRSGGSDDFIASLCLHATEIRHHQTLCYIASMFMVIFSVFQSFIAALMPSCTKFNKSESANTLSSYLTILTRIVPIDSELYTYKIVIPALFVLNVFMLFNILFFIFLYKPSTSFTKHESSILILIPIVFYRIISLPCYNLLVYEVYQLLTPNSSIYLVILMIFNTSISCFGSVFLNWGVYSFPNFPKALGYQFSETKFSVLAASYIIIEFLQEFVGYVDSIYIRAIIGIYCCVISFILYLTVVQRINSIDLNYSVILAFLHLFSSVSYLLFSVLQFTNLLGDIHYVLTLSFLIPCFVMSRTACETQYDFFRSIIFDASKTHDYSALESLSVQQLIPALGHSFPLIAGDWSVFEWASRQYPKNIDIAIIYAKFLSLSSQSFTKQLNIIRQHQHESFVYKMIVHYLEVLISKNDSSSVYAEHCHQAVNDYFMHLHLFWTEILLGKNDRLISISNLIYSNYTHAQTLFHHFGHQTSSYSKFKSVMQLRIQSKWNDGSKKKHNTTNYVQHFDTLRFSETVDKEGTSLPKDKVVSFFQKKLSRKISVFHRLIFALPYLSSILIMIIFCILFSQNGKKKNIGIDILWKTLRDITTITYSLGGTYFGFVTYPFINLSKRVVFNNTYINLHFHNNQLYHTLLDDPSGDVIEILGELSPIMKTLPKSLLSLNLDVSQYNSIFQDVLPYNHRNVNDYVNEYNISAISSLSLFRIDHYKWLNRSPREVLDFIDSPNFEYFANNSWTLINFFSEFLRDLTNSTYHMSSNEMINIGNHMIVVAITVDTITAIVMMLLIYYLSGYYQELFKPLFVIPKNSISSLLNTFGIGNTQLMTSQEENQTIEDSKTKYILGQLSYEKPSTHFQNSRHIFVNLFVRSFLAMVFFTLSIVPIIKYVTNFYNHTAYSLLGLQYIVNIPLKVVDIGQTVLWMLCIVEKNGTIPPYLLKKLINLSYQLQKDMPDIVQAVSSLRKPFDSSYFLESASEQNKYEAYTLTFSFIGQYTYMLSNLFMLLGDITGKSEVKLYPSVVSDVVSSIIAALTLPIPVFSNEFFHNTSTYYHESLITFYLAVLIWMCVITIIMTFPFQSDSNFIVDSDFGIPIYQTIPMNAAAYLHQNIKSNSKVESTFESSQQIINDPSTYHFISQMIMMLDKDNIIISATPSLQSRLQLETTVENIHFQDFLNMLKAGKNPVLPPTEEVEFEICLNEPEIILKASLIPYQDYHVDGKRVNSICILEDITNIVKEKQKYNQEFNRYKLTMTQIMPPEITQYLDSPTFEPIFLQKIVVLSINITKLYDIELISKVKAILRKNLMKYRALTYMGRSVQVFRVVSGINERSLTTTEQAVLTVKFALSFMKSCESLKKKTGKQFDVYCGIQVSGPNFGDILSSYPPAFVLYGNPLSVSTLIAGQCSPNQVNISRDVCKAVLDQGFILSFENEITRLNGTVLSIHQVQADTITL